MNKLKVTIKEVENRSLPSVSGIGVAMGAEKTFQLTSLSTSCTTTTSTWSSPLIP